MSFPVRELAAAEFPPLLREIPQPPKTLRLRGNLPDPTLPLLAVVGSRRYTTYGAQAVSHFIGGLRGYNIGIVSGMAIGIDGLAHEAALAANLYTLAIPGSGLSDKVLYPARNRGLARKILEAGGGLMSELPDDQIAASWTFPQRNRLVCGIAPATLLIEAAEQSGTLITARLAADYNRELLVVPGNIFSNNSRGVHQFLKLGATPVTEPGDIIDLLSLTKNISAEHTATSSPDPLVTYLQEPHQLDEIITHSGESAPAIMARLMELELSGIIEEREGLYRTII